MLCPNLQLGVRRTRITPGWVILAIFLFALLNFDEFFVSPAHPLYLWSQRQVSPPKSQQVCWPKQQRGGTGNVHKDEPTVHKGLADVLKDKIGLGKKKTSGSWISIWLQIATNTEALNARL